MFERFTERARQVVVLAEEEARDLKHNYCGTEHLLLGLIREEEGLAARVLESLDVILEQVREQVVRIVGRGEVVTLEQIPKTPRFKKVVEMSLREALSLGHNYIGTEHLLLALVREGEGVAARILADLVHGQGEWDAAVRNEVIRMLSGPASRRPRPPERRRVTREDVTPAALGKIRVRVYAKPELTGTLVGYSWELDRCTVSFAEGIPGGLEGTFEVQREALDRA